MLFDDLRTGLVFMDCMAVETVRQREGIRSFFDECRCAGLSSVSSFRHYIAGLDTNGTKIDVKAHLSRGGCLLKLTNAWLDIWEPKDWSLWNLPCFVRTSFAASFNPCTTIPYVFSCRYGLLGMWHLTSWIWGLQFLLSRLQILWQYCKYLDTLLQYKPIEYCRSGCFP